MSYPRHLRVLVVEDEQKPHDEYEEIFSKLRTTDELGIRFDMAPPVFARCYEDAKRHLEEPEIYHLVIADLGLPHGRDEAAEAGVEPGKSIVLQAARREKYPVPVLLVISGRLHYQLGELRSILEQEFWHGELVTKGFEQADRIINGLQKALEYVSIGIHLHNAPGRLCPTMAPREEDLLRRCVLRRPECCGVDAEWWGSYYGNSGRSIAPADSELTKVLIGRFILRDGRGVSRPVFIKFEPREIAEFSHHSIQVLADKLSHVKVVGAVHSKTRSLLVTEKAGASSSSPMSLQEVLNSNEFEAPGVAASIAIQIAAQLNELGQEQNDRKLLSQLLWATLDLTRLRDAWKRHGGGRDGEEETLKVLEGLRASTQFVSVTLQSCTHGDLHVKNVAFDRIESGYRACLIDPGWMTRDLKVRDLANLEVSLLLHHASSTGASLVESCRSLYESGGDVADLTDPDIGVFARHTVQLIHEIRRCALQRESLPVYAVSVFNFVMMQLEGLEIQSRDNQIVYPPDAVFLARLTANWVRNVAAAFLQPGVAASSAHGGVAAAADLPTPTSEPRL